VGRQADKCASKEALVGGLSPWHLGILLVVLLLVFGAKKLPELGRGIGSGMREFKKGVTGEPEEKVTEAITTSTEDQRVS
jgi:sec-independent protein translocase protein TatA